MLVTVLMSVYNAKSYLGDAIESILNQTYRDFEFIIIDDGSIDGSREIIQKYAMNDSRIIYVKNKTNIGLAKSLNKGVKLAKGEYIARQDADDFSATNRLEIQLNYAMANSNVDLLGSNCFIVDISGKPVCEINTYSEIKDYKTTLLNKLAIFPHGSAFIKKTKLIEVGLYDERFFYSQDGELWLRFIKADAKIHVINSPLYYYRTLPVANNKKKRAQQHYNQVKRMIYNDNCDKLTINNELIKIRLQISDKRNSVIIPNYMAGYWKGLANTIYFNKPVNNASPYQYLYKATKEQQPFYNYLEYLKLGIVYAMPPQIIKRLRQQNANV
jgi:glycosyltransferase involved in cell wall biosynthesis